MSFVFHDSNLKSDHDKSNLLKKTGFAFVGNKILGRNRDLYSSSSLSVSSSSDILTNFMSDVSVPSNAKRVEKGVSIGVLPAVNAAASRTVAADTSRDISKGLVGRPTSPLGGGDRQDSCLQKCTAGTAATATPATSLVTSYSLVHSGFSRIPAVFRCGSRLFVLPRVQYHTPPGEGGGGGGASSGGVKLQYPTARDNYEGAVSTDADGVRVPHGKGRCVYADKTSYEGDWVYGKREGEGIYVYANGLKFEGNWKNGIKHGKGTYTHNDGSKYEVNE